MNIQLTDKTKSKIKSTLSLMLKILIAVIFLLPFYWAILTSFRDPLDIISDTINLLPTSLYLEHYKEVLSQGGLLDAILNTLFMTLMGVFLNIFFCSLAGYAFARLRFKGNKVIFAIMMMGLMIPGIITLIPSLLIIDVLNLYGTWLGVILPGAAGIFNIFFMRQFFITLPKELGESAKIDGANEFTIFFRVYLPLVKPALATITIFTFQGNWNSFLWPYLILDSDQLVIATYIRNIEAIGNYGLSMAASMLGTLPLILVFLIFQRYFIKGIATTGLR